MKKGQYAPAVSWVKLTLLFGVLLLYTPGIAAHPADGTGPVYSLVVAACDDTAGYADSSDDTVQNIARFDHAENGSGYYYVRLSMFRTDFERLHFYEKARDRGIYISDKYDFHNDSAIFVSEADPGQALTDFRELYQNAAEAERSTGETIKSGIVSSSPFYHVETAAHSNNLNAPFAESNECSDASVSCSGNVYTFPAGTSGNAPPAVDGYPNYGCLNSTPCPAWYYMQVGAPGDIIINIAQSGGHDVDFICWGPFTSLTDGCATGLTGTCSTNGSPPPDCCNNNSPSCVHFYPRGNITDCSYSPNATENCNILNAQVGEIYILLLTNFSQQPGTITFSQTGGSGITNCNLIVFCSMIAMTATPTSCDGLTNTFSVAGNIEFSNPAPTGLLTITDNTAIPPVSQSFTPPFASPLAYNLTNIPCDGAVHSLTAVFSDSLDCNLTHQFTAPGEICPTGVISGGGVVCDDGTQATVGIGITGSPGPYNFTWAVNGTNQPPVVNYNGPFPYPINTNIPGLYTLVSVSNAGCPANGTVSGTATVTVNPLPVPVITGAGSVCAGTAGELYETEPSMTGYIWTVSSGGTITSGAGTNTVAVNWNSAGLQTITVNYTDGNGCTAASPAVRNVTVNPLPAPVITGSSAVCAGTTSEIYATGPSMTGYAWTITPGGNITAGFGTNTIAVSWNNALPGQSVAVNCTNAQGCSKSTIYTVTVHPLPMATFTTNTPSPVCQDFPSPSLYTVDPGGPAATYQWQVIPANYAVIADPAANPASITWQLPGSTPQSAQIILTATNSLTTPACTATSAPVTITINPKPFVSLTPCFDLVTNRSASPFLLKGGNPLLTPTPQQGEYLVTPVTAPSPLYTDAAGNYYFDPAVVPGNLTTTFNIFYKYTSAMFGCPATTPNSIAITVHGANPPCSSTMTDHRDLPPTSYQTGILAGRCWMLENLRYGTKVISPTPLQPMPQTDNCIVEKYCMPADSDQCTVYGGLYQWDELVQYRQTQAPFQGACPPGWHVPTQQEWQEMINAVTGMAPGDGSAGSILTDLNPAVGFHALLRGIYYLNNAWAFDSGNTAATMFWTSSMAGGKPIARGLNFLNPSVSMYESSKANAFPVRCVMN